MKCKECGKVYEKWYEGPIENGLCLECNEQKWREWEEEEKENLAEITRLQLKGHTHHCACRQVWGDGECECDLYKKGYDPYRWLR